MEEFVMVLETNQLEDGRMTDVSIDGQDVLIARIGERFYAAGNVCPHMRGKLSRGSLKGTVVTCPLHGSQYDLKDGRVVRWTGMSGLVLKIVRLLKPPRPLRS